MVLDFQPVKMNFNEKCLCYFEIFLTVSNDRMDSSDNVLGSNTCL